MRPYIPVEILMRETPDLQKSVAADLNAPDRSVASIISEGQKKSTKKGKEVENSPEHDSGAGGDDNNEGVEPSSK